jgi:hypothetical protein
VKAETNTSSDRLGLARDVGRSPTTARVKKAQKGVRFQRFQEQTIQHLRSRLFRGLPGPLRPLLLHPAIFQLLRRSQRRPRLLNSRHLERGQCVWKNCSSSHRRPCRLAQHVHSLNNRRSSPRIRVDRVPEHRRDHRIRSLLRLLSGLCSSVATRRPRCLVCRSQHDWHMGWNGQFVLLGRYPHWQSYRWTDLPRTRRAELARSTVVVRCYGLCVYVCYRWHEDRTRGFRHSGPSMNMNMTCGRRDDESGVRTQRWHGSGFGVFAANVLISTPS